MIPKPGCCFRISLRLFPIMGVAILLSAALTARADEPATVEQVESLLDLRTVTLPEGAKVETQTLGELSYECKGDLRDVFGFLSKQFADAGWKGIGGDWPGDKLVMTHLSKDHFIVGLFVYSLDGLPMKDGWWSVHVINHGNIPPSSLPKPPAVKKQYIDIRTGFEGEYLSADAVPTAVEKFNKLLVAEGWEPYGVASTDPEKPAFYFKRNAIRVELSVWKEPTHNNPTVVRYSTDVLSADLPVPPEAREIQYVDAQKRVTFDWPGNDLKPLSVFYKERLTALGWKPLSSLKGPSLVTLSLENDRKDSLTLEMKPGEDVTHVQLKHQTEKEAESDRKRSLEELKKARQDSDMTPRPKSEKREEPPRRKSKREGIKGNSKVGNSSTRQATR